MNTLSGVTIHHSDIPANRDIGAQITVQPALIANEVSSHAQTRDAVKVNLSVEGLQASASAQSASKKPASNEDKDIAKIRERIKELQQAIQEQLAQLQSIQSSKNVSDDEKTQRIEAINQQLASLNASLASATAQLMEALKGKPKTAGAEGVQPLPFVQHESPASGKDSF
jgi:chromosome segregation ATPase